MKTHGMSKTRIYRIWRNMINRCYNKNNYDYNNYGGKGVKVCERWLIKFDDFYTDTKEGYSDDLTLDRFPDKNGNYEPSNCRWATPKEQANNRNSNVFYDYNGSKMQLGEICDLTGISYSKLETRIRILGMTAQQAADIGSSLKKRKEVTNSMKYEVSKLGLNYRSVTQRMYDKKITFEDSVNYYLQKIK